MQLKKNCPLLVLRFTQFGHYDFVKEHNCLICDNGFTWMLKKGRNIPLKSLETVLNSGGGMILKAPKKAGGIYYYAHFSACANGVPQDNYNYPRYYAEITDEYVDNPLDGTWIKLDYIHELSDDIVEHLYLSSNDNKVVDVIGKTRTSVMYAYLDENFKV